MPLIAQLGLHAHIQKYPKGNETSDHATPEHKTSGHMPSETIRMLALQSVSFRYPFQAGLQNSFTRLLHYAYIPTPHLEASTQMLIPLLPTRALELVLSPGHVGPALLLLSYS